MDCEVILLLCGVDTWKLQLCDHVEQLCHELHNCANEWSRWYQGDCEKKASLSVGFLQLSMSASVALSLLELVFRCTSHGSI